MKALASDFDNTLFFLDIPEKLKKEDCQKIKDFQEKGYLFGLCTGRPLSGVKDIIKDHLDLDFYILTTGAVVLDHDFQIIEEHCLDFSLIKKVYETYRDRSEIVIQANHAVYAFLVRDDSTIPQKGISDIEEVKDMNIQGISFILETNEQAKKLQQDIVSHFPELDAFVNVNAIDAVAKGCSKGKGISIIKQYKNIDIMGGIGDSYNDLPMLDQSDISFTFHNSSQDIQQHASYIVDSIEEALTILENQ